MSDEKPGTTHTRSYLVTFTDPPTAEAFGPPDGGERLTRVLLYTKPAARTRFLRDGMTDPFLSWSAADLLAVHNALSKKPVQKFETTDVGRRRVLKLLEALPLSERDVPEAERVPVHRNDERRPDPKMPAPRETATTPTTATTNSARGGAESETDMAAKKSTAKKAAKKAAKKPAAEKKAKAKSTDGKPAKAVAEFKQVRDGTVRQQILKLMDGKHTAETIGEKLGKEAGLINSHIFCLWRDCGIGYTFADGKVTAVYPGSKTYKDAIKAPAGE